MTLDLATLRASHAILAAALLCQPALWLSLGALWVIAHRLRGICHELERARYDRTPPTRRGPHRP